MLTGRVQASAMSSQSPCLALLITQLPFGFHLGAYERFGNHQAKIQDSVSFQLSLHQGDADMP